MSGSKEWLALAGWVWGVEKEAKALQEAKNEITCKASGVF
jgi:hypothetical protein